MHDADRVGLGPWVVELDFWDQFSNHAVQAQQAIFDKLENGYRDKRLRDRAQSKDRVCRGVHALSSVGFAEPSLPQHLVPGYETDADAASICGLQCLQDAGLQLFQGRWRGWCIRVSRCALTANNSDCQEDSETQMRHAPGVPIHRSSPLFASLNVLFSMMAITSFT